MSVKFAGVVLGPNGEVSFGPTASNSLDTLQTNFTTLNGIAVTTVNSDATGTSLIDTKSGNTLTLHSLTAGTNITIIPGSTGNPHTINAPTFNYDTVNTVSAVFASQPNNQAFITVSVRLNQRSPKEVVMHFPAIASTTINNSGATKETLVAPAGTVPVGYVPLVTVNHLIWAVDAGSYTAAVLTIGTDGSLTITDLSNTGFTINTTFQSFATSIAWLYA